MKLSIVDNFAEELYESNIEDEVRRAIDKHNKDNKQDSVLFVLTLIIMIIIVAVFTFIFKDSMFSFILPSFGVAYISLFLVHHSIARKNDNLKFNKEIDTIKSYKNSIKLVHDFCKSGSIDLECMTNKKIILKNSDKVTFSIDLSDIDVIISSFSICDAELLITNNKIVLNLK